MRALAGPAVALTMAVGFLAWRALATDEAPTRAFTDLELSLPGEEGSCYALGTVLVANALFDNAPRTWQKAGDDAWRLTIERVIPGYGGPTREFSTRTFARHGKAVELTAVEASPDQPQEPADSIDQLLEAPNTRHSTPVERCLKPGASGYRFTRK
jgi:hypothetical protein